MSDQKFQLRYSAAEDRVLIISGTHTGDMRCFALTRRMIGQLWPGMNKVIAAIAPPSAAPPQSGAAPRPTAGATAPTSPEAAPSPLPAVRPDAPGENPFGAPPPVAARHLVRKLQLLDRGASTRVLVLAAADTELRVPLDDRQLMHIYEALRIVIERADWGIDLDAGLPDPDTPAPPAPEPAIDISAESPSRYRH